MHRARRIGIRKMKKAISGKAYHHGDLSAALRQVARAILEEEGFAALSLRSVARRAGVSHAAPYRHFPTREALLAAVAAEGIAELRAELRRGLAREEDATGKAVAIGTAYLTFAARHSGLLRLMFGAELPNRKDFPALEDGSEGLAEDIGQALGDATAGLTLWGAIHGLALLTLDNVIDLGQRQSGVQIIPSRAGILLRSALEAMKD